MKAFINKNLQFVLLVSLIMVSLSAEMAFSSGGQEAAKVPEKMKVPKKITILAPKIARIVTTTGAGGNLVDEWLQKTGVKEVEWIILPWQDVAPRFFRESSLPNTDIDLGLVNEANITHRVTNLFEPLDGYMKSAPIEDYDDLFPGLVQATTFDQKPFAVWFRQFGVGLHYNEVFFKERGLAGPPTSLDEFLNYARKSTYTRSDGGKVFGLVLAGETPFTMAVNFARAWDGDVIDTDLKVACNKPPMVKAISTLRTLYEEGVLPEGFSSIDFLTSYTWMQQGRGSMTLHAYGKSKIFNNKEQSKFPGAFKTAPFPVSAELKGKYGVAPTNVGGWAIAIPKNARNKDLSWDFIRFMSSKDSVYRQALNGNGPVRASTYQKPDYRQKNPWAEAELETLKAGRPFMPAFPESNKAIHIFSEYAKAAILGQTSPQEAMDKASAEIEKLLK